MLRSAARKKYLACMLLASFLISVLVGCSPAGGRTNVKKTAAGSTRVITDCTGRQVRIPVHVKRIACLYAFTGHAVVMLGRGDDVVAINTGLSRDVLLNKVCAGIGEKPVPFSDSSLNIEELLKTRPDLVFISGETGRNRAETMKLNKFKIPYLVIDFNSIEEQKRAVQVIGDALGVPEKARRYNEYYQSCIDRVQKVVSKIPEEKRVRVYHSVNEATRTDPPGSLGADWMEKAGVVNVSVGHELRLVEGKNFAGLEQILLWNPDVIIVNEPGVADYIRHNPQWAPLKAVKDGKVYQMPIGISRWGHPGGIETPLAVLWTAKTVYPQYFSDLDVKSEARRFYKEFYNYSVSDEMLDQILAGKGMRRLKNKQG